MKLIPTVSNDRQENGKIQIFFCSVQFRVSISVPFSSQSSKFSTPNQSIKHLVLPAKAPLFSYARNLVIEIIGDDLEFGRTFKAFICHVVGITFLEVYTIRLI